MKWSRRRPRHDLLRASGLIPPRIDVQCLAGDKPGRDEQLEPIGDFFGCALACLGVPLRPSGRLDGTPKRVAPATSRSASAARDRSA